MYKRPTAWQLCKTSHSDTCMMQNLDAIKKLCVPHHQHNTQTGVEE